MPSFTIRSATDADYPALAELHSTVHPDDALPADELRHDDAGWTDPYRLERFVAVEGGAEEAGRVVGAAAFMHSIGSYHPKRFLIEVQVFPDARGRGIGGALWRRLRAALAPLAPLSLRTVVRDDDPRALRFARDRGFVETKRDRLSTLELAGFDPAAFAAQRAALERAGVRIATLAELEAAGAEWRRRWYQLFADVRRDVPRSEPVADLPYERFTEMSYDSPGFAPDLALVALHGGDEGDLEDARWIGRTQLWRAAESGPGDDLFTGLTGVVRDWRRRGVALALKVAALERGAASGFARVHTDNDERNAGMLAINERLGFVAGASLLSMLLEPVPPQPEAT